MARQQLPVAIQAHLGVRPTIALDRAQGDRT